jgi:hypothetical protein
LFVALSALALAGGAMAQTMKPGLWEVRQQPQLDAQQQAQMDQARQQMAAMPPEQRKQMEAMMAQRGMSVDLAGGGTTVKVCITKEQASRDAPPVDDRGDCKQSVKRDGAVIHTRFECSKPPSKGEGEITLSGPEAYSMQMRVTSERGGKPATMVMKGQGRWLGTDCGNVKPRSVSP